MPFITRQLCMKTWGVFTAKENKEQSKEKHIAKPLLYSCLWLTSVRFNRYNLRILHSTLLRYIKQDKTTRKLLLPLTSLFGGTHNHHKWVTRKQLKICGATNWQSAYRNSYQGCISHLTENWVWVTLKDTGNIFWQTAPNIKFLRQLFYCIIPEQQMLHNEETVMLLQRCQLHQWPGSETQAELFQLQIQLAMQWGELHSQTLHHMLSFVPFQLLAMQHHLSAGPSSQTLCWLQWHHQHSLRLKWTIEKNGIISTTCQSGPLVYQAQCLVAKTKIATIEAESKCRS